MKRKLYFLIAICYALTILPSSNVYAQEAVSAINLNFKVTCSDESIPIYDSNGKIIGYKQECQNNKTTLCYSKDASLNPNSCEFIKESSLTCLGRKWSVIYGMPSVDIYGYVKMSSKDESFFAPFGNDPFSKGQGIYTSYPFKKGFKYNITLTAFNGPNVDFRILATSAYGASNTSAGCGSVADPTGFPPVGSVQQFLNYELVANNNYSQLCLFSTSSASLIGGSSVNNVSLTQMVVTETPPIVGNNICCNQTVNQTAWPFQPLAITQASGKTVQTINGQPVTYKWQINTGSSWVDIVGATSQNYTPTPINNPVKYRRLIISASLVYTSTSNEVTVEAPPITGNQICCDQTIYVSNGGNAASINPAGTVVGALGTITYEWQYSYDGSNWVTIISANSASYTPLGLTRVTRYRRIVKTIMQPKGAISNSILVDLRICNRPGNNSVNEVCGDQYYYNLQYGNTVNPLIFYGSLKTDVDPNRAEFDFEWQVSYDKGASWQNVGPSRNNSKGIEGKNYDYQPGTQTYDLWWGLKEVWYKRTLYAWYDNWNCGPGGFWPCGAHWHDKGASNIVRVYMSPFIDPKDITIWGPNTISCSTISFGVGLTA